MKTLASRLQRIEPFYVMEVHKQAQQLEALGRRVIHLSIGEPDFGAPPAVAQAFQSAVASGQTGYTEAKGLKALREAIAGWYANRFDVQVDPANILVTQGASGALTLACLALVNPGDEILMPDPSYACNRHFVAAADGHAKLIPCPPEQGWQLTARQIEAHWSSATRGVMVASPANPTGTSVQAEALNDIAQVCKQRGGFLVSDEIYQMLAFENAPATALQLQTVRDGWDGCLIINSFSKYFGMTGWRLGWMVAPSHMVPALERLAQNLTICASTPAQRAALACFQPDTLAECESRRQQFAQRQRYVLERLSAMRLAPACPPDAAFYVWIDIGHLSDSSTRWCRQLLEETGVCLVPGRDFSPTAGERHVRLSFATDMDTLREGLDLLEGFVRQNAQES